MVVLMALRDNVYQQFGPLILEALIDNLLEQINILRFHAGLPEMPKEAFLGSAHNHLNHLDPYEWMPEE